LDLVYLSLELFKTAEISDIKTVFASTDRNNRLFRVNNRLFVWNLVLNMCKTNLLL